MSDPGSGVPGVPGVPCLPGVPGVPGSPGGVRARIAAVILLAVAVSAGAETVPATSATADIAAPVKGPTDWRGARSDQDHFVVRWRPVPAPVPFNQPFELEVEISRGDSGEPLPGAQVVVSAWMPAHRHGMARRPRVEDLGDGRYRARGLLLHMQGHWQLFVDTSHGGVSDRAEISLELGAAAPAFSDRERARILQLSPLPEPPDDPTNAYDTSAAAARLGQFLFFDQRLSGGGDVSCASCHVPHHDFSDGIPLAKAVGKLARHTPSLWNVAYHRWFFWDGRADSLWAQALQPLEDVREHAGNRLAYAHLVARDPDLRRAYTEVFGDLPDLADGERFPAAARPVPDDPEHPEARTWAAMSAADRAVVDRVFANLGKALAGYQRRLVSRDAPFDRFVRELGAGRSADTPGMSESAKRGLKLFLGQARCHLCHSGANFTDYEFHNTRVPPNPDVPGHDPGRFQGSLSVRADPFNGLGAYSDARAGPARRRAEEKLDFLVISGDTWGELKTPSLRNVAVTPPYMHQGQLATLEEVVDFYSDRVNRPRFQVHEEQVLEPVHLSAAEKADLIAFLEALTDTELPPDLLQQPETPYLPSVFQPLLTAKRGEPCD